MTYACKHFEDCGGCTLQHMQADEYKTYKNNILIKTLNRMRLEDFATKDLIIVERNSRRRVELKVQTNKSDISIGFYQEKSHQIVNIEECAVTQNEIIELIPNLKASLAEMKKPGNVNTINITNADNGLDLIFSLKSKLVDSDKSELIKFARKNKIIRLSIKIRDEDFEKIYERKNPIIVFGETEVELPIGAFLQATKQAQNTITDIILDALKGCRNIADLYCGCGTFSFPLEQMGKRVIGYEGSSDMVMAMYNAIEGNMISSSIRDLYKQPLKAHELRSFDSVVINPPRNGALPQAKELANSDVKKIVMVSCSPKTFERDGKELLAGGYKLVSATPIDQFLWSDHLELVGVFEK